MFKSMFDQGCRRCNFAVPTPSHGQSRRPPSLFSGFHPLTAVEIGIRPQGRLPYVQNTHTKRLCNQAFNKRRNIILPSHFFYVTFWQMILHFFKLKFTFQCPWMGLQLISNITCIILNIMAIVKRWVAFEYGRRFNDICKKKKKMLNIQQMWTQDVNQI